MLRHVTAAPTVRTLGTVAAAGAVVLSTTLAAAPSAQALTVHRSPARVTAVAATQTSLALRWRPVAGAHAYTVQLSTTRTMAHPTRVLLKRAGGRVTGLLAKQRYYFRVAAANPSTGGRIGPFSKPHYRRTAAVTAPTGLQVVSTTDSSASLTWIAPPGAIKYRVEASTSASFGGARVLVTTSPSGTVTGLGADTAYNFRVRAIRPGGSPLTVWSTPTAGRTAWVRTAPIQSGSSDIRVGTFNVLTASTDTTDGNRLPWAKRRGTVIRQILGENVDVVGVQEASQSYAYGDRMVDGPNQYLDLLNGLNKAGGSFALTNQSSYNCVNPQTSYGCTFMQRQASGGDRIYYNTKTLDMVSQGAYQYPTQNPATPGVTHSLAYATFEVKATGKQFLFTTTHLDPPDRDIRVAQWHQLIAKVNQLKGDLPVVNVGDYNTQKQDVICQTMLPAMKDAGYGDVLNQQYATALTPQPRAQHTINGWINSLGRFDRNVKDYSYYGDHAKTGNSIDWIFASNQLPVKEFKMVLDYDPTSLQVTGPLPSDHHMERATLTLP